MTDFEKKMINAMEAQTASNNNVASAIKNMDDRLKKMEKGRGTTTKDGSTSTYSSRGAGSYASALTRLDEGTAGIFRNSLTDYIEAGVRLYGGLIDYGSSELENRAAVTFKLQGERLTDLAFETQQYIGSKSIMGVFGSAEDAREELAAIYDANSYYLNRIGEDYKKSDDAGLQVMANSLIVKKALRINQQDFAKIIENQMASSKKVTEQVFQEIAFYAGEYSNRTSASIFQITNQLTRAVSDFDTFGGASVESLGRLAGFMGELKMDTESVAGLIKRMQSFEGSVQIVRDLAGAFGAVIDPAKLMGDAINDPAEALNTIRQSLFDAGHNSESLGFKITLLANSLNVSSEAMRRFLNEEIDAQQVLNNSVKATEFSTNAASKVIEQTQKQIVDTRSVMATVKDIAEAKSESVFQDTFKSINQFRSDLNQFISNNAGDIMDAIGQSGVEDFGKALNKYTLGASETVRAQGKQELDALLEDENFSDAMKLKIKNLRENLDMFGEEQLANYNKHLEESQSIKYTVDFDPEQIEATYKYLNKSDEIETFHNTFNSHFDYVRQNSDSKFMVDVKAAYKTFRDEIGKTLPSMQNFLTKSKEIGNIEVNFKILSGEKEMSLEEYKKELKVVSELKTESDPNKMLSDKIDDLIDAVTNNKLENVNVMNEIVAEVALGKTITDEFKIISQNSTVEVLQKLGVI